MSYSYYFPFFLSIYISIFNKDSLNHAFTLHLAMNLILVAIAVSSYFLLQAKSAARDIHMSSEDMR